MGFVFGKHQATFMLYINACFGIVGGRFGFANQFGGKILDTKHFIA